MIKPICCVLAFVFSANFLTAQTPQSVIDNVNKLLPKPLPQAPNVASLGRYGEYPVSYFTGLPEISIPIFEVKSGSLSVPVTLSYHASGIRKSDDASWVGLGWSLSTGGQISRKVQGRPDEEDYISRTLIANPGNCTTWQYLELGEKNVFDLQPDIFSYSFPGTSGNFILGKNGATPFVYPYRPIVFNSFTVSDFRITDENGILYRFGKNAEGAIVADNSSTSAGGISKSSTVAWHLTEILSPTSDDKILYAYQSQGTAIKYDQSYSVAVTDNCFDGGTGSPCISDVYTSSSWSTHSVGGSVPKFIQFNGGVVKFVLGGNRTDLNGLKTLDRVEIYSVVNADSTLIKSVKFYYSYFQGETRLRLDSLVERDNTPAVKPIATHKFSYHGSNLSFGNAVDYWGYYNGRTSNTDLIPQQVVPFHDQYGQNTQLAIGGANRDPDSLAMKQGVLNRIDFPTGGYTEFYYEAHQFYDAQPKITGGLRVRKIISSNGNGHSQVKTYKYGLNESGYGSRTSSLNHNYFRTAQGFVTKYTCGGPADPTSCTKSWETTTYMSDPMFGLTASEGSPVVYQDVTEYIGTPTNNLGKTVFQFDNGLYANADIIYNLQNGSNKQFQNNRAWKRGKLTRKEVFDAYGNLLNKTEILYEELKGKSKYVGTLVSESRVWPGGVFNDAGYATCLSTDNYLADVNQYAFQNYSQSTGQLVQKQVTETSYLESNPLSKTTVISYDTAYTFARSRTETGMLTTENIVTNYKYPFDFSYTGSETGTAKGYALLKANNILTPVEEYVIRKNADGSNSRVLSGQVTAYKENSLNPSQVLADEVFLLETNSAITNYSPLAVGSSSITLDSRYKSRIKMQAYDRSGNLQELKKTDDNTVSYLWGYNNNLPIAEVKNTDLNWSFGPSTYFYGTSISTNQSSYAALTPSLVIDYQQTVQFSIQFFLFSGTPTIPPLLDIELRRSDGAVVFNPSVYEFGTYSATFTLPAGTYTFYHQGQSNSSTVRYNITVNYSQTTSYPKAFHTSFEETGVVLGDAKTGRKVNVGPYQLKMPSASGNYWVSWWQKTGQTWSFQKQLVALTGSYFTVGSGADYVDEVRLYPETASMTTYTYNPVLGITSTTDANNLTTYYEYDTFGRLQLIRDDQGNILKTYTYNYKNQY